jgi:hypothetical protein
VESNQLLYVGKDRHVVVKKSKKEEVDSDSHLHVKGCYNTRTDGCESIGTGSYQVKVGKKHALEAGEEVHYKANTIFAGEGASDVTVKGPGGFLRIDAGGVTIKGTLVKINEGGAPGSGSGASPAAAVAPVVAKDGPVAQNRPPALEIADRGGTAITATQTVIVGQKVTLQVRSNPAGQALTNVSWVIPDEKVKNYTQSSTTAVRTDLAAADLRGTTISFYWISGGTKTVEVTATLAGSPARATATFNVLAPTNMSMTSVTSSITVDAAFNRPGTWLHYGNPNTTSGITWTFTATAPAGGGGQIAATQTINADITQTLNNGTVQHFSTSGRWLLDTTTPYAPAVAISASAAATWTNGDSPGVPLWSGANAARLNDDFHMYFMYKPSGADSIWVTLGRLDWHCRGSSTRSGAPAANTWSAPTGIDANANPSGSASTELPTWPANYTSLSWV